MSRVSILDYGMGNLRSVQKAFEHENVSAEIVTTPQQIAAAERLVLPGVGALLDAMKHLHRQHLVAPILDHIEAERPFLGVCLGMQMLCDLGFESGETPCLGVVPGICVRLEDRPGLKIPHMGWNTLEMRSASPLFKGIDPGSQVYFVHSYHVQMTDPTWIAATSEHGQTITASVWKDNVVAAQFHPEKSQAVGLKMLANFARM